jgi:hypothetical protein
MWAATCGHVRGLNEYRLRLLQAGLWQQQRLIIVLQTLDLQCSVSAAVLAKTKYAGLPLVNEYFAAKKAVVSELAAAAASGDSH